MKVINQFDSYVGKKSMFKVNQKEYVQTSSNNTIRV